MKKFQLLVLALGLYTLSSCDKEADEAANSSKASSSKVEGNAVKGLIAAGKVDVYAYLENGQRGKLLGSTTTDASGRFSLEVDYRGPAEVVVSQGSYSDEATGTTVAQQSNELKSVIMIDQAQKKAAVTALTTIAAQHVKAHASAGIQTAITNANREVAEAFGLTGIDISTEAPADLSVSATSATEAQVKYGAVQAGLSQAIKENNLAAEKLLSLVADMSADFSDGSFDGKSGSAALNYSVSITPQQALNGLSTAIEHFLNSTRNKSGRTAASVKVTVKIGG